MATIKPEINFGFSLYKNPRVIVVDDSQHVRILITEIIKSIGLNSICEASDGHEGFKLMQKNEFDLVITDLLMQPMDGIEFVRLIRNAPESRNPKVPIVMITGHSTATRVSAARDVGVDEFLTKPFTARGVVERLHQAINHPRPYVRSADYLGPDRRRRDDHRFCGPWRRLFDIGPTVSSAEA